MSREFKVGDRVRMGNDMFGLITTAIPMDRESQLAQDDRKQAGQTVHTVIEITYKHLDPREAWMSGGPYQKVHLDPPIFEGSTAWVLSKWLELAD